MKEASFAQYMIKIWASTFYIELFLYASLMVCLYISVKTYKREAERIMFMVYCLSTMFLFTIHRFINFRISKAFTDKIVEVNFQEGVNVAFTFIEFSTFYLFFYRALQLGWIKKLLLFIYGIIFTVIAVFAVQLTLHDSIEKIQQTSYLLSSIEMLFLLIPCLIYFYELFQKKPILRLSEKPSFYITTGLMAYSGVIIPFFVLADKLNYYSPRLSDYFYTAHYGLLGILFLAIAKASYFKKPLTS